MIRKRYEKERIVTYLEDNNKYVVLSTKLAMMEEVEKIERVVKSIEHITDDTCE